MRVLMNIQDLGPLGGLEQHVFQTARVLAGRGHQIDLLYGRDTGFADDARAFCSSVIAVPGFEAHARHPVHGARQVWPAIRAGARRRPDVVYANRFAELAWALPSAVASRSPLVCHLHYFKEHKATRLRSTPVTRFISVSQELAGRWVRAGLDPDRVTVVPSGIEPERFPVGGTVERDRARAALGLPGDAFIALYCGRISGEKGVDVLLDAWRAMDRPAGEARLVLVGASADPATAGAYERDLIESAPAGCLWLPARKDVVPAMHAADVVVLPSRADNSPRTLIEAMATGRPVVATRVGGIPELLDGDFARFLVDPDEPAELAARISQVAGWRDDEPGLGDACAAHVRDRFALARITDRIEGVLESARGRR
jgi:glycosyltransferase involved in cell wall biosynthesis